MTLRKAGVADLSGAALSYSLPEGGALGTALTDGIFRSGGFGGRSALGIPSSAWWRYRSSWRAPVDRAVVDGGSAAAAT